MKKIDYPTDGSETAKEALKVVVDLARQERSEVIVAGAADLGTVEEIKDTAMEGMIKDASKGFVTEATDYLEKEGIHARGIVEMGRPNEVIVNSANSEGASMIVMGTHRRTGLARAIIRSVTDRVIRHARQPVVLVPAKVED